MATTPSIKLLKAAPDPLGLYIHSGRIGQPDLLNYIVSRPASFSGVVFAASKIKQQAELLSLAQEKNIDTVLDPQAMEMATPSGYNPKMDALPWSAKRGAALDDFDSSFKRHRFADRVANFAVANGFTQILSPSHLISTPDDPWLSIDVALANDLRWALAKLDGGNKVQIQYSLVIPYDLFRSPTARRQIVGTLMHAAMDGIWLNISGCGRDSSPAAITRYCNAAVDFQGLNVPIVAEHVGGFMGLALLAFGGVGGISHGITLGERLDLASMMKPPVAKPMFGQPTRVYVEKLDVMLLRGDAEKLFEAAGMRARSALGCRDTRCCPRGVDDMLQTPVQHFLYQRSQQVAALSQVPETLRPGQFLEDFVRPASDLAIKVAGLDLPDSLKIKFEKQSKRLNMIRTTLGPYARERRNASFAMHPIGRSARG